MWFLVRGGVCGKGVLVEELIILISFVVLGYLLLNFVGVRFVRIPSCLSLGAGVAFFVTGITLTVNRCGCYAVVRMEQVNLRRMLGHAFFLTLYAAFYFVIFLGFFDRNKRVFAFKFCFNVSCCLTLVVDQFVRLGILGCRHTENEGDHAIVFINDSPTMERVCVAVARSPSTNCVMGNCCTGSSVSKTPRRLGGLNAVRSLGGVLRSGVGSAVGNSYCNLSRVFYDLSRGRSSRVIGVVHFYSGGIIRFCCLPHLFNRCGLRLSSGGFVNGAICAGRHRPLSSVSGHVLGHTFSVTIDKMVYLYFLPFVPVVTLVVGVRDPNPVFFHRTEANLGNSAFVYLGFHSVRIGGSSSGTRTAGGSPEGFTFNGFVEGAGVSRFPRFVGMLGNSVDVINPEPRVLCRARICNDLVSGCVIHRFSGPKVAN